MKTYFMMALVAGAMGVGLTGCTDPIQGMQDKFPQPAQVLMSDYWRQGQVHVELLKPERLGAGQLKIHIQLRNLTDWPQSLDYKVWYVDETGAQFDNEIGWQHLTIPPRGYEQPDVPASMSAAARDFRIQIRKAE